MASSIVAFYNNSNSASIRDSRVYLQYSTRSEISVPSSTTSPSAHLSPQAAYTGTSERKAPSGAAPNSILLVSVHNTRNLEVTLDNIHQTFKMCGTVLKIVTFVAKNGTFKALVHMGSVEEATHAMNSLDSREMFSNCCALRIGFSNLTELRVKSNCPTSWDFTTPHEYGGPQQPLQYQPAYQPYGASSSQAYLIPQQQTLPSYSYDSKQVQQFPPVPMDLMYQDLSQTGAFVLLVNNLSTEMTPDSLFNLFGVYGDVIRVKILYNKRDTALIQYSASHQAHQAYIHLNHLSLHGKELAISFSKHRSVAMPRDPTENNVLTKNYLDSPFHRFRSRDGRSSRRVYINPPSKVLHISNLYDDATDEELQDTFGNTAIVQFFTDSRRMAYVVMPTVHDAVLALMRTHNLKLGSRNIRVSFSAKTLNLPNNNSSSESKQQENEH